MKQILPSLIILILCSRVNGQTKPTKVLKNKEIKLEYSDGLEVFNVFISNPDIKYIDTIEYTWYTEFSRIKTTMGGSGGLLLNGNSKFYDLDGNLRNERCYVNGVINGISKNWDSEGNLTSQYKYSMGNLISYKYRTGNFYYEKIGNWFDKGSMRKIYSLTNKLIEIDTFYSVYDRSITMYFENSNVIKSYRQANSNKLSSNGIYKLYYLNGKIKEKGQYWDSSSSIGIKVGNWTKYELNGTKTIKKHKRYVEYWDNGMKKEEGSVFFDVSQAKWVRDGDWQFYNIKGKTEYFGEYINGELIVSTINDF